MNARPSSAPACVALLILAVCVGCSKPQAPDKQPPSTPQAAAESQATELRDAIQQPLDQAEAVKQATEDAAKAQRAEIDAATGG